MKPPLGNCTIPDESEVVLTCELDPAIALLRSWDTGGSTVGVVGHLFGSGITLEGKLVIASAVDAEAGVWMVEPVGCRYANFKALGVIDTERLEDGEITSEVVRRTDVRPDPLPHGA